MKKLSLCALGLLMIVAMQALAQEHFTEGPVWQVSLIRVKPNQQDAYLASIRQKSKPFLDELKQQGLIMDYKWFLKGTKHDPQDWDMALGLQFKNFAALDGLTAKEEPIRDKIFGQKRAAIIVGQQREEIREVLATFLMREITLK
jgi:hypothetical protein